MRLRQVWAPAVASFLLFSNWVAGAQGPAARLSGAITNASKQVLNGSRPPRALPANDLGALPKDTAISGMTLVYSRSAAQELALQNLLAAQQNPASPLYHQWLTPETFGAQFGMANADLAQVESWLTAQGFTVGAVSRAHDRINFSGSAAQVNAAFGTELHRYKGDGKVDYAPSTDLSLPTSLAPLVTSINHLSTFRPKPMVKRPIAGVSPNYTVTGTQEHFLTPGDVATMYDVNSLYKSGFTGAGQTIAVAGETYIQTSDVSNFESAVGLPTNLPNLVLEPNTGASAIYEGDEFESDIDVEYATGMAPGANVLLVYVGDSPNYSVFDAFDYAIEQNLAPVVSVSYGSCEASAGATFAQQGSALFEQGAAQGQTLIASAGDSGSTECFGYTDSSGTALPASEQEALAINYPADSPYITAIGGTQMAAGTFASTNTQYWATAGSTSVPISLLSYVPETVWNEDSTTYGFASGGGGVSTIFPAPTWQTGVPGIPAGNAYRLNPDISFQASTASPGYLACTSDPSAFATGQTSSCVKGIYDTTGKFVTAAGGTSFGAPIFAGLMAVINQHQHGTGQGLVNQTLYSLASNSTTYASAFHDITTGDNGCEALTGDCTAGVNTYAAGTGYDEATGLGSIDVANLVAAWPASTASALAASTVAATPATSTPASGASDVITVAVSSALGTPTGTVTVMLANETAPATTGTSSIATTPASIQVASLTLTNGQASYTFPGTTTAGTQILVFNYSGDATHASSTTTVPLTLANTITPTGAFTFTVGSITVPTNSVGQSTIVITPTGGYNGVINFTIPSLASTDCFQTDYSAVSGVTQINLYVGNGTACTSGASYKVGQQTVTFPKRVAANVPPAPPSRGKPLTIALAGMLGIGFAATRRRRRLATLLSVFLLSVVGFGLSGCGGSSTPVNTTPIGGSSQPVTLTLSGADTINTSISSSATFSLTTSAAVL